MASIAASLAAGRGNDSRRARLRISESSLEIPKDEMFSAIVTIERASGVKACDRGGTSDPYALVYILPAGDPINMAGSWDGDGDKPAAKGRLLGRTPTHHKTLEPVWNFPVYVPALQCPTMRTAILRVEVWDKDAVADDFIGMVEITADDFGNVFATTPQRQTKPLQPRPIVKKAFRTLIDEGVTGTISFHTRLGSVDRDSATDRKGFRAAMKASFASSPIGSSSFTAYPVPSSLQPLPPSFFRQASAAASSSSSQPAESASLFSLRLTFHGAANLLETGKPNPYVLCWLVSRRDDGATRELIFRSPVVRNTLNPVWESKIIRGCVRSSDVFEWELRSWKRGARDFCFGTGSLAFPDAVYPIPAQPPVEVPLRARAGDTDVRGTVTVSYETKQPVLDRTVTVHDLFETFDASVYLATPFLQEHCTNYGISIPNFRDIGGWPVVYQDPATGLMRSGRMRTRTLFRTSGISRATELDAEKIVGELGIKSFIDLRTADYAGNRGPYLTHYFDVMEFNCGGKTKYSISNQQINLSLRDVEDTIIASSAQKDVGSADELTLSKALEAVPFDFRAEDAASTSRKVEWGHLFLCSLVGKRFELAIIRKSKKAVLLTAGLLASSPQEQRRIICGPIFDDPNGLTILYQMLVEHSKAEFLQFFELLLEVDYPLAYFCNHGKDRTGMVTAFIQSICGVKRETIIDNYMLSDYLLRPLKTVVDYEMMDGGLTPEIMSRTPAQTMHSTLKYIDDTYGGVAAYLAAIGFSKEKQAALRSRLVDVDPL